MSRPKVYDYDPASEEQVVMQGAEGAIITWFGIRIDGPQEIHITCAEGTLNQAGDGIEDVTRTGLQETLTDQDALDFYTQNKAAIDAVFRGAYAAWADKRGKTGTIVES